MYLQHKKSTICSKPDKDKEIKCKDDFMNNTYFIKRFMIGKDLNFSTLPNAHRATQVILQEIKNKLIYEPGQVFTSHTSSTQFQELSDSDDESYQLNNDDESDYSNRDDESDHLNRDDESDHSNRDDKSDHSNRDDKSDHLNNDNESDQSNYRTEELSTSLSSQENWRESSDHEDGEVSFQFQILSI